MSSRSPSTARRRYPASARGSLTCRISTGERDILSPSAEEFEAADHDPFDREENENREHRREVEAEAAHAQLREKPPKEAQVGVDDVVEEPLHAVQPDVVREWDPR